MILLTLANIWSPFSETDYLLYEILKLEFVLSKAWYILYGKTLRDQAVLGFFCSRINFFNERVTKGAVKND